MWQIESIRVESRPRESMYRHMGILQPEPEQLPDRWGFCSSRSDLARQVRVLGEVLLPWTRRSR